MLLILGLYCLLIFAFLFGLYLKKNIKKHNSNSFLKNSTILIPFKNEAANIKMLLDDLVLQSVDIPIIVINDHSSDESAEIVMTYLSKLPNLNLLNMDKSFGKKQAIDLAIKHYESDFYISLDADVRLHSGWFASLKSILADCNSDLIILPVKMNSGSSFFEAFQVLEFSSLIASTFGAAKIGMPIMCNGANLVFSADLYKKYYRMNNYSSGDDMFLLEAALRNKCIIDYEYKVEVSVNIDAMPTIKSFINQRKRWAGKSLGYRSISIISVALIILLANISIVAISIGALIGYCSLQTLAFAIFLKILPDFLILRKHLIYFEQKTILRYFAPIFFIYPIYIIATAFTGFLSPKRRW